MEKWDDEKLDDADADSDFNPEYDELDADDGDWDTEDLQENEMSLDLNHLMLNYNIKIFAYICVLFCFFF